MLKSKVLQIFEEVGDKWACSIIKTIPDHTGILDAQYVDKLLYQSHCEIQRLHEEFLQGQRILHGLRFLIRTLQAYGQQKIRIIDVGCGLGYIVRWLSAYARFPDSVELIGVDYNAHFIAHANRLAQKEWLNCRFLVANAFAMEEPAHIFMSSGVIHHFRDEALVKMFKEQSEAMMCMHYDIQQSWLAPLGAWLFHMARMRVPLAKHDGIYSALRAHSNQTLLRAAREGLPEWQAGLFDIGNALLPMFKVLRPIIAIRKELYSLFLHTLGKERRRWITSL